MLISFDAVTTWHGDRTPHRKMHGLSIVRILFVLFSFFLFLSLQIQIQIRIEILPFSFHSLFVFVLRCHCQLILQRVSHRHLFTFFLSHSFHPRSQFFRSTMSESAQSPFAQLVYKWIFDRSVAAADASPQYPIERLVVKVSITAPVLTNKRQIECMKSRNAHAPMGSPGPRPPSFPPRHFSATFSRILFYFALLQFYS